MRERERKKEEEEEEEEEEREKTGGRGIVVHLVRDVCSDAPERTYLYRVRA